MPNSNFSKLRGDAVKKPRLSEAQAIEIAKKEFTSLGGKGVCYPFASFADGVWRVDVGYGPENNHLDVPEIRVIDETGEIVPHHTVRKEREAARLAYLERLKVAKLTEEKATEIFTEHAVSKGYVDFELDVPLLMDGGVWFTVISGVYHGHDFSHVLSMYDSTGEVRKPPLLGSICSDQQI